MLKKDVNLLGDPETDLMDPLALGICEGLELCVRKFELKSGKKF